MAQQLPLVPSLSETEDERRWHFDVERGPDSLFVHLREIDPEADDNPPLAELLLSALDQHFVHRLVLELDEVELLGSGLLGQLTELGQRLQARGGMLRVCGLSPAQCRMLEAAHLDEHLAIYGSRVDALVGHYPTAPDSWA